MLPDMTNHLLRFLLSEWEGWMSKWVDFMGMVESVNLSGSWFEDQFCYCWNLFRSVILSEIGLYYGLIWDLK